jgi:cellulose synthase/poly-beta-1,6-N-acetylglucosamine synthase-like glycosyltransferase
MYNFPDPKTIDPRERRIQRFYESLPGLLAWGTFLFMIIFSYFIPFWVSLFVIVYDLHWIFKSIFLSTHLVMAYKTMRKEMQKNWWKKLQKVSGWQEMYHVVIFPTYDESKGLLAQSIKSIQNSNYDLSKVMIVVATEAREGEARQEKEDFLKHKFAGVFDEFLVFSHPDGVEGELKGKGANVTYAAKQAKEVLTKKKITLEKVILSTLDSDTVAHPSYLALLTYTFLNTKNPYQCSYQPLPMYHNNIWDAPAVTRIMAVSSSFWHMMESMRPERLITFSSHSMSFKTLVDVNYWPVNMVSDDSVIFWKCVDYFDGEYGVVPLHIPVSLDAVQGRNVMESFLNQYKQMRRWAYGVENLAVVMRSYWKNPRADQGLKIKRIWDMIYGHYTWATASFLIAVLGFLPVWLGGQNFRDTVISYNLPILTGTLVNISLLGLILTAFINILLLPPKPRQYSTWRRVMMFLQWGLVPVVAILLGALPALDAQTRLMFKKYLGFWVTPKVRK